MNSRFELGDIVTVSGNGQVGRIVGLEFVDNSRRWRPGWRYLVCVGAGPAVVAGESDLRRCSGR